MTEEQHDTVGATDAGSLIEAPSPLGYGLVVWQLLGVAFIALFYGLARLTVWLPLAPMHLAVAGYGAGLLLFVPGAFLSTRGYPPGKTLLGGGMSFLFFSTSAMLFQVFPKVLLITPPLHPYSSFLACLSLVLLFGLVAWRAFSQSASLLTLLLGAHACMTIYPELNGTTRAGLTFCCVFLAGLWTALWLLTRSGRLFTHLSLCGLYGLLYYVGDAAAADGSKLLAATAAAATVLYAAMSGCAAVRAARHPDAARGLRLFFLLNTLCFCGASVALTHSAYPGFIWIYPGAVAAVGLIVACLVRRRAGTASLVNMLLTQTAVACMLAGAAPLSSGSRLAVLAGACVLPAVLGHRRADSRQFRATEYAFIVIALASFFFLKMPVGYAVYGPPAIPMNWAPVLTAAGLFCLMARLHAGWTLDGRYVKAGAPKVYRPEQELLSLSTACAAAFLIALHTIMKRGDAEFLPLALTAQGMLFAGLGMVLFTPALASGGLTILIAGHVCWHVVPLLSASPGGSTAFHTPAAASFLWTATLILALYHDYRLRNRDAASLGLYLTAATPYAPALLLAPAVLDGATSFSYAPALAAVAALPLLWIGLRFCLPGAKLTAVVLLFGSAAAYPMALWFSPTPAYFLAWHLPALGLHLASCIAAERAVAHYGRLSGRPTWLASNLFCLLAAAIGATGCCAWNPGPPFIPSLIGLAALLFLIGLFVRARSYYCAALALLLLALFDLLLSAGLLNA